MRHMLPTSPQPTDSKIWTLSGTLRGFYDDNYLTASKKTGSYGFEASPSFSLNAPFAQTEIGVRYIYGLYYYQTREQDGQRPIDQSHEFDLWLDHAFNPRWEARFEDVVSVYQEPQLTTATATPERIEGNNLANDGTISLTTDWTSQFSTKFKYENTYYTYDNNGGSVSDPSLTGLLDRDENLASIAFQWAVDEETVASITYQYGQVVYTGGEPIAELNNVVYDSASRDNRTEYGFAGLTHQFLENLSGAIHAGVQYTSYYGDSAEKAALAPYGDASLTYTYLPGSYIQLGVNETRNATDTASVGSSSTQLVEDQQSTVVFGQISDALTPKIVGSLTADYQYSIYHGGGINDQDANFATFGVNLTYNFNVHFSSEIGYNFDWYKTASVLNQDYNRNRIYLGVTATY